MIIKIIKTFFVSLLFLVVFLVMTFPYGRLAPKVQLILEKGFSQVGFQPDCSVEGFDIAYPFGFQWTKLGCYQGSQTVLELSDGSLSTLPKRQHLVASIGKGSIDVTTNANIKSPVTHISAAIKNVAVEKIAPLIMAAISSQNPRMMVPKTLKLEGSMIATIDMPLLDLEKRSGKIDVQFANFKIPQQSFSELFGLKDLVFSKANIKAELKNGKLTFNDFSLISPQVSLKVEGGLDIQNEFMKSTGPFTVKWKIEKSDALISSPMGAALANANCPSQDTEGFCTKRYQRVSELMAGL